MLIDNRKCQVAFWRDKKCHLSLLVFALLFASPLFSQNVPYSDITLSSRGTPVGGAPIAVCNNPGLSTTAAQVISNIAVLTMSSNPITAGFVANQAIAVSGFTGADTYFNGGTVTSTGITSNFLILSVTSTQVTYALTHANASATTNGSVFQAGSQAQACAPLATIYSDTTNLNPITQPGLTSTGLGNYQFFAIGATAYYVQFYGATIGEILKPIILPCGSSATCTLTGQQNLANVNGHLALNSATGSLYPCTTAGLNTALAALPSLGGTVDMTACGSMSIAGPIVLGATVNQPVDLQLPYGVVTFTNTGGNGFIINGIGSHLHGYGPIATIVNSTGNVGDYIHVEPPTGSQALTYVEVNGFRVDHTNCATCIGFNILSVRDPSSFHNLETRNWSGTTVQVTTSANVSALIPQGISFRDFYSQSGTAAITANSWIVTGNEIEIGNNVKVIIGANAILGSFSPLVIEPTSGANADGRGNHFFGSSVACASSSPTGLGILITSPSGGNTGAQGNTIGPANHIENCTTGWKVTGFDASHKGLQNVILQNAYFPSTTNLGIVDFATTTIVREPTNGNAGDVQFTANSNNNQFQGQFTSSPTDITVAGNGNSVLTCYTSSNTPVCTSGNLGPGGSYFTGDTIQNSNQLSLATSDNIFNNTRMTGNLHPSTAGGQDIGSAALPFGNFWLGTAATNNFKFQPAATSGARIITITDPASPTTVGLPLLIASGTSTLTSNATLGAGTCQAVITTAATGALTTDSIEWSFATAPATGDAISPVASSVTSGNVNFTRCNPTAAAQNVTAIVINWRVIR